MLRIKNWSQRVAVVFALACAGAQPAEAADPPVPLVFDTDIGNDVDDALALGMIHALQSRGECRLLAVTVTKDEPLSAPFIDAVNTFYGRGEVPIGVVRGGATPEPSKFTRLAEARDDERLRYPHDLFSGADALDAVDVLRRVLAAADDGSVVIVQVGFSTNLARLLNSPADKASALDGAELVQRKVRLLSAMAGAFGDGEPMAEYNVKIDIPAARALVENWPTPIMFSGFEVGVALEYPAESIERDYAYVAHHPLAEAYWLYEPPPHNRPTWDLTSALYAVRPDRGYFDVSPRGRVTVDDAGITSFVPDAQGRHRRLILTPDQRGRTLEALVQLASQPPAAAGRLDEPADPAP
jgi:purine nucleosidase